MKSPINQQILRIKNVKIIACCLHITHDLKQGHLVQYEQHAGRH